MSYVNSDHNVPFARPFGFIMDVARRVKQRRELNSLLSMPDYQLRDIGLMRGDVMRESLKSVWRE